MNLTSWDLSYPTQTVVIVQTIFTGFLIGSVFVVNCIYKPWLKKIEDEEESMLDQTFNLKDSSRLSCQLEFKAEYSGIKLELAPE